MKPKSRNVPSLSADPRTPEAIRLLELFGAVVFENVMSAALAEQLAAIEPEFDCYRSSYDENQLYSHNLQWSGQGAVFEPLRDHALLQFLQALFGDSMQCTGISFSCITSGYRGMALHSDGKPHCSDIFGSAATCPVAVRVLVYPDGTDETRAPLLIVPGSHLSLHADANPYRRYRCHPDEVPLICRPGGAIVIHHRVFHRAGAHTAPSRRRLYAYGLRPAWAGPVSQVAEPTDAQLRLVPEDLRELFRYPNRGSNPTEDVNFSDSFVEGGPGLSRGYIRT